LQIGIYYTLFERIIIIIKAIAHRFVKRLVIYLMANEWEVSHIQR